MARPKAANWIAEATTTSGTGDVTLVGSLEGFAPFSVMGDGLIYYTLQDGLDKECGVGTLNSGKIQRTTVLASFINGVYASPGAKLDLSGYAEVYCTVNADLFNAMNDALDKLDGIEPGATADQTAAEVPYDGSDNFMFASTDVNTAIDLLSTNIAKYSGAALYNDQVNSFVLLANGVQFVSAQYFINPVDMSVYRADAQHTGTITSFSASGTNQVTIVTPTGSFNAFKTKMATQDWVTSRESRVVTIADTPLNQSIDASLALTFNLKLTLPSTNLSFILTEEVENTQHETILILEQGTGVNKVVFPPNVKWAYGNDPVLSYIAGAKDMFSFVKIAGDANWYGSVIGGAYV